MVGLTCYVIKLCIRSHISYRVNHIKMCSWQTYGRGLLRWLVGYVVFAYMLSRANRPKPCSCLSTNEISEASYEFVSIMYSQELQHCSNVFVL